jgi:protein phosphatase PTC6
VLTDIKESQRSGSTGTIALLQSLDEPAQPYFAAKKLHLTIGHCGQVSPRPFPISFPISISSSFPEYISFSAHSSCQSISLIPLLTSSDTRALLCSRETGEVIALTEQHHAEARVEATRLRRMGAKRLVADSFGESRWMGVIENTRG